MKKKSSHDKGPGPKLTNKKKSVLMVQHFLVGEVGRGKNNGQIIVFH